MTQQATDWAHGPTDADLAAHDAKQERLTYEDQLDMEVARRVRALRVERLARDQLAAELAPATPPFDAGLLDEVLARPQDPPHRCDGLIPYEAGTLLVAQRKTGKTTLQLNLARALITGDDFLGRFPTRKIAGNVAILNYEVSAQQLARWAREVGIPGDRLFLVNLRGRRNPLGNDTDRELLAAKLRALDTETLIVDPFGRAYTGTSQNDPGEVGTWLADLDRFARGQAGALDIILAAHAGWSGERARGASALEDWADVIVTLTRDDQDNRYLAAEGRDIDVDEDQLTFDARSRHLSMAGTGSRRTSAKVAQVEALKPVVLELLRDAPTATLSGNKLDEGIKDLIRSGDLDAKHSKGDGARAANLMPSLVGSKDGSRGARLFFLLTSPTSLNIPEGSEATSPTSPYRGVAQGTEQPTSPEHDNSQEASR